MDPDSGGDTGSYRPMGNQPVRVLELNILDWFEDKYQGFRAELEAIGAASGASRTIKYYCGEAPILDPKGHDMTPHVKLANGQICLHETFLSYVWALSYAMMVVFDEGLHGPKTGKDPGHGKPLGYFLAGGYGLLDYGLSLIREYKPWPQDLPSPDPSHYTGEDTYYPTRASGIYLAAVDFILCHELAHIACGHLGRHTDAISRGQVLPAHEIRAAESEADAWAMGRVTRGIRNPDRPATTVGFGAIAGLASVLLLGAEITSITHPDTDERIRAVMQGLGPDRMDNLWGVVAAYYIAWSVHYGVDLQLAQQFDTYGDCVDAIEKQLRPRKDAEERRRFGLD